MKVLGLSAALFLFAGACSSPQPETLSPSSSVVLSVPSGEQLDFGEPPATPIGDLDPDVVAGLDYFFGPTLVDGVLLQVELEALQQVEASQDPRVAWIMSDLLRITNPGELRDRVITAAERLTGRVIDQSNPWGDLVDHLIAWDTPAPPNYLNYKRSIYILVGPSWEPLFADESAVDWRLVSWGGVGIDNRPYNTTDDECSCIPAADNPPFAQAADTTWLDDDDVVFGVVINGEARAYPRQIMEVREMVNDTLGGRTIGMPYCTLCGSAQVYFTDDVPGGVERPILRTSGLLIRSNKVMYELNTMSVFDTFTGAAVTGELWKKGVVLVQAGVVTTTWGEWKAEHRDTTALLEEVALGRDFDFRNGRDADGPIFPIGNVDPRLPVQEDVVGIVAADGTPIAFHLLSAKLALKAGQEVSFGGVELVLDAGGVRAVDSDGRDLGSHQAFWFAWSQFYPETEVWPVS